MTPVYDDKVFMNEMRTSQVREGGGGAWREGHGTYKGRPTMNLITRYGLHGLVWVLGLGDFIVQNLAPPNV